MKQIYMAGADIGMLEEALVMDALRNGWYEDKYLYCEAFEDSFARFHNRKYALMTPNCTSAIHLLLASLGIGEGDEVILPECTWIASAVSTVHLGATPVFCDIEKDSWCLDPESVRKAITDQTKAIIVVDLFGNMANWEELNKISEEYNIPIVEDAAEALGSTYNDKPAGNFGIGSTFSFHNTKTITSGEGGMLVLDDDELYDKCVKYRDLGRGPNTKPYYNELVGYKFMPCNIQAALGFAQFRRLPELLAKKRKQFDFYKKELSGLNVKLNYEPDNVYNSAWITTLVLDESYSMNKDTMIESLKKLGVPSRPFFYPLSSLPAFGFSHLRKAKYKGSNRNSYNISNRGINLPGAYNLEEDQLKLITDSIKKVLE